jgi:hypothetical protein
VFESAGELTLITVRYSIAVQWRLTTALQVESIAATNITDTGAAVEVKLLAELVFAHDMAVQA